MEKIIIEIIGYVASAFVAISLVMVSILKLRVLNLIGAFTFVIYGIFISSIPIIVTNSFITIVDLYFLINMLKKDTSEFTYLEIGERRKYKLIDYINNFIDDIKKHYPLFNFNMLDKAFEGFGRVYLALRGFKVVGFAYYTQIPDSDKDNIYDSEKDIWEYVNRELFPEKSIYLNVDYVTAKYRDMGLVKKLYSEMLKGIDTEKVKFIISINENTNKRHHKFLTSNGYKKEKEFDNYSLYVFSL